MAHHFTYPLVTEIRTVRDLASHLPDSMLAHPKGGSTPSLPHRTGVRPGPVAPVR